MRIIPFAASLSLSLFFCVALAAAGDARIAVISMERVFETHQKTREANALLKTRIDEIEKEREKLMAEVKRLRAETETLNKEAGDGSLSKAEQARKREIADEKHALFRDAEDRLIRFDQLSKSELGGHMRATQEEIVDDIRGKVQRFAREKNIVLVLDNSGKTMNAVEAVIHFDGALDITDAIIALLNEESSEE